MSWLDTLLGRTPTPAQRCKIYIYQDGRNPLVIVPEDGMSENTFRNLNNAMIFNMSEIELGGMGAGSLVRVDFRTIPLAIWVPF